MKERTRVRGKWRVRGGQAVGSQWSGFGIALWLRTLPTEDTLLHRFVWPVSGSAPSHAPALPL